MIEEITSLLAIDRSSLDGDEAIAFLQSLERILAHLHGVQAEALVAAASPARWIDEYLILDPRPDHDEERSIRIADAVREEIGAALRWSPAAAQARIDTARLLCGSLTATKAALLAGAISPQHAVVIAEAAERVPEFCAQLQDRVLAIAVRATVSRTRQAVNRVILSIDADGAERRRRRARCTRDVFVVDELDGISVLMARMATDRAHAVMASVDSVAHVLADSGDPGTIGEFRCEALARLVLGGHDGAAESSVGAAPRVHLDIVVSLDALLGVCDEPAELAGSGSVSIDTVADLLADPDVVVTMRRLLADRRSGHLLDLGRSTYRIPSRLREFIVARDRTCRFPGCARRASLCQIDHCVAWHDGGTTDVGNLGALCVRHHQLKTHAGWRIANSKPDGSCEWFSPQGRRYAVPARLAS